MRLFLGVDGGQSGTTALIGDEAGRVLGAGSGGPCNHAEAAEGRQKLLRAVGDSVAAACARSGLPAPRAGPVAPPRRGGGAGGPEPPGAWGGAPAAAQKKKAGLDARAVRFAAAC